MKPPEEHAEEVSKATATSYEPTTYPNTASTYFLEAGRIFQFATFNFFSHDDFLLPHPNNFLQDFLFGPLAVIAFGRLLIHGSRR
jgi:hypothetical protein